MEGLVHNRKKYSKGQVREEHRANDESWQEALHVANQAADEVCGQLEKLRAQVLVLVLQQQKQQQRESPEGTDSDDNYDHVSAGDNVDNLDNARDDNSV